MPLPTDAARKLQRSWVLLTSSGKTQADAEGRQLPALSWLLCQHRDYLPAGVNAPRSRAERLAGNVALNSPCSLRAALGAAGAPGAARCPVCSFSGKGNFIKGAKLCHTSTRPVSNFIHFK